MCSILGFWFLSRTALLWVLCDKTCWPATKCSYCYARNAKAATDIPKLEAQLHAWLSTGRITSQWIILICTEKAKLGMIRKFHSDIHAVFSPQDRGFFREGFSVLFLASTKWPKSHHSLLFFHISYDTVIIFCCNVPPAWPKPNWDFFFSYKSCIWLINWSIDQLIDRSIHPSIHPSLHETSPLV